MKRLIPMLILIVLFSSGCTWKRNLENERVRTANMAVLAGEGYKALYEQSLTTSELLRQQGHISSAGINYLFDLADAAAAENQLTIRKLEDFNEGNAKSSTVEKYIERLKERCFSLGAAIRAYVANESLEVKK